MPQMSIAKYVGFALWFLLVFGLIFEVPLAITLMAKLGWVDAPTLRKHRKWALLGSFIFAALLTPTPDPFNQCLMAFPMYIFYEAGIVSAKFFYKKKPEEEMQGADDAPPGPPGPHLGGNGQMKSKTAASTGDPDREYVEVPSGKR